MLKTPRRAWLEGIELHAGVRNRNLIIEIHLECGFVIRSYAKTVVDMYLLVFTVERAGSAQASELPGLHTH
jgi:hypothetical protein